MRRTVVALFVVSAVATFARAVPPERPAAPVPGNVQTQANAYANQVISVISVIREGSPSTSMPAYYRDVSAAVLAEAALVGLFEVAREPLPSGLKADLARADSNAELRHVLTAARERLGDAEAIRGNKGVVISIRAMTRVLDPHTGIPTRNDSRRTFTSSPGITGVGIELDGELDAYLPQMDGDPGDRVRPSQPTGPVRIADVLPGGPAQLAGIRPGDVITQIDGHDLNDTIAATFVPRLSAAAGDGATGKMSLTIRRPGRNDPIHVDLVPTLFRPETVFGVSRRTDQSWNFWLDHPARIGYLRIGPIDLWRDYNTGAASGTDVEAAAALNGLLAPGLRGLVLDLRTCPGGFIDPALKLIGLFVNDGPVATVKSKRKSTAGEETRYATSPLDTPLVTGIPIIVLINAETIGGGEMIAAALKDNKVAMLAGQQTFGKGSVQSTYTLPNTSIPFKMTTGLIYRPNGKPLQKMPDAKPGDVWGVRPDPGLEVPLTPDFNKQLKEWMRLQVLRPGDSPERLPLDDPENDPARQFALRELLKRIKQPAMLDHETFIRMIIQTPRDDGPRLVYADWLEEQGDSERAEFIRVQIELASWPDGHPRRGPLIDREKRLFARSAPWTPRLESAMGEYMNGVFRRGFFELTADLVWVPVLNDALAAGSPVTAIHLYTPDRMRLASVLEYWRPVTWMACVERVASLKMPIDDIRLPCLLESPRLKNLFRLELVNRTAKPARIEQVLNFPRIKGLHTLTMTAAALNDEAAAAIAASPRLLNLSELNLHSNQIGNNGARAIAASRHLSGLKFLDLGTNRIGQVGAIALAESSHLPADLSLDVGHNPIDTQGREALRRRFGERVNFE